MILFYLLVSVMPLTRHPLWGRMVGELTVTKYLGIGCFLYALLYWAVGRKPVGFFRTWQARWFILFEIMALVSYKMMGLREPFLTKVGGILLSFVFLFFITLVVVDSISRLRWVLLSAIGSVAFASLYVLRDWQANNQIPDYRPGWIVGDPNYFALSAVLCVPLAVHLALEWHGWRRLFCLGCALVILVATTLGASRGGFLGLVAAMLLVLWRSRHRTPTLVLVSALALPMLFLLPSSPVRRLQDPSYSDKKAEEYRLMLWTGGLEMIKEHPWVGVGWNNFIWRVNAYTPIDAERGVVGLAHNTYIQFAAELGIPGLMVFLSLLISSIRSVQRVRRRTLHNNGPPLLRQAAVGLEAGLVGFAVNALTVTAWFQKLFWVMIFLTMCLVRLEREVEQQRERSTAPMGKEIGEKAGEQRVIVEVT